MFLAAIPNLAPSAPTGKPTATVWLTGVVIVTRAASWSLLRFEVWGGERGVVEDVLVLIQISFNPSSLALCPSITPPPSLSPSLSPLHPFPPSSHHLPPQGCNTGRLSGEERVKERGRAAFSVSLFFCMCVLRLNTLFVVYVRLWVRRGTGGEGEQMDSLSPLCCIVSTYMLSPSILLINLSFHTFPPPAFLSLCLPLSKHCLSSCFSLSFTLCCLVADGSVGQQQQQQQQSRSQSVSKREG